ncbi:hypothetical protein ABZP36_018907 [Zizania latifolia]
MAAAARSRATSSWTWRFSFPTALVDKGAAAKSSFARGLGSRRGVGSAHMDVRSGVWAFLIDPPHQHTNIQDLLIKPIKESTTGEIKNNRFYANEPATEAKIQKPHANETDTEIKKKRKEARGDELYLAGSARSKPQAGAREPQQQSGAVTPGRLGAGGSGGREGVRRERAWAASGAPCDGAA